jgi:hypothetical protein
MSRLWPILIVILAGTHIPQGVHAQNAFDDLPIDDPSKRSILKPGEDPVKKIRNNIFIVATIDHRDCYPGQQVLLSYRLYTALHSSSSVTSKPLLNGFTIKERKADETPLPDITVDGRRYHGFTVWQALLTPLQTGEIIIDPLTVNNDVSYTTADGKTAHYSAPLNSKRTTINVRPIPAIDRPAAFNGLVGKWQIHSHLASPEPDSSGSDTLFVEITGKGSFDNITPPYMRWPVGLKHAEPIQRFDVKDSVPNTGSETIAIPFTATAPGQYMLPAMQLAYWDPGMEKYQVVQSDSLTVHVLSVKASTPAPPQKPVAIPEEKESPLWQKFFLPVTMVLVALVFLILRVRRRRPPTAAQSTDAAVQSAAARSSTAPPPAEPAPAAPQPEIEPLLSVATPLPAEERTLADIKQSLITFLQTRLGTDAWAEEDLMAQARQKEPALAGKAARVLDQCNQLLYSPIPPEPKILAELGRRLDEVLKS